VRVGLSEEEKIEHALAINLMRRHLSREQRQELVARLRQRGLSLRRIAELLGVHHDTIREDLSGVGNPTPENQPVATGADGKTYPARQRTEAERQELARAAGKMKTPASDASRGSPHGAALECQGADVSLRIFGAFIKYLQPKAAEHVFDLARFGHRKLGATAHLGQ